MRRVWPQLLLVILVSCSPSRAGAAKISSIAFSAGAALPTGTVSDSLQPGVDIGLVFSTPMARRIRVGGDVMYAGFKGHVQGEDLGLTFNHVLFGVHGEFDLVHTETARLYARPGVGFYWVWGEGAADLLLATFGLSTGDFGIKTGWNAGVGFEAGPAGGRVRYGLDAVYHGVSGSAFSGEPWRYVQTSASIRWFFGNEAPAPTIASNAAVPRDDTAERPIMSIRVVSVTGMQGRGAEISADSVRLIGEGVTHYCAERLVQKHYSVLTPSSAVSGYVDSMLVFSVWRDRDVDDAVEERQGYVVDDSLLESSTDRDSWRDLLANLVPPRTKSSGRLLRPLAPLGVSQDELLFLVTSSIRGASGGDPQSSNHSAYSDGTVTNVYLLDAAGGIIWSDAGSIAGSDSKKRSKLLASLMDRMP